MARQGKYKVIDGKFIHHDDLFLFYLARYTPAVLCALILVACLYAGFITF